MTSDASPGNVPLEAVMFAARLISGDCTTGAWGAGPVEAGPVGDEGGVAVTASTKAAAAAIEPTPAPMPTFFLVPKRRRSPVRDNSLPCVAATSVDEAGSVTEADAG